MQTKRGLATVPCPVVAISPPGANHYFGFYDICPWDPDENAVACLRYAPTLLRLPGPEDVAEVCIWDQHTGAITAIGTTRAWNYQQGARLRWLDADTLLYNDLDGREPCARVVTRSGTAVRTLPGGLYALAPDGRVALSPSFGRLGRYYSGYGYLGAAPSLDEAAPADDGVWAIDPETGAVRLIISLAALANLARMPAGAPQFVSHMMFSPSGRRFLFCHTYITGDGAMYTRLLTANPDGGDVRCLASEFVSHPFWYDDETIISWTRRLSGLNALRRSNLLGSPVLRPLVKLARRWHGPVRNSLLNEGLFRMGVDNPDGARRIAAASITENGHFMRHPRTGLVVGDTYADADKRLTLFLYDVESDTRIAVATFNHGIPVADDAQRCDLHPRWNRTGDRIAVDTCENGTRRLAIVDVSQAVAQFGGPASA